MGKMAAAREENHGRRRVLAAAQDVTTAVGLHGTTHRAVAAAAGVSVALIRYHFKTKAALLAAVAEAMAARLEAALETDLRAVAAERARFDFAEVIYFVHLRAINADRSSSVYWLEVLMRSAIDGSYREFARRWRDAHTKFVTALADVTGARVGHAQVQALLEFMAGQQLKDLTVPPSLPVMKRARDRIQSFCALLPASGETTATGVLIASVP